MTGPHGSGIEPRVVADARQDADAAARHAGVEISPLDARGAWDADALFRRIWGAPVIEAPLMIALAHSGAYVVGARDADSRELAGACVGYFARPLGTSLHSHVAGVDPGAARRGIGIAMKLDQRAWALEQGLSRISWTFDPLVSRNAAFNLHGLHVEIDRYLVDFYGDMTDGVNAGQGSDRLLVSWPIAALAATSSTVATVDMQALVERASALVVDRDGEPESRPVQADAPRLTVAVPRDIEALRGADPALAARWRHAVRDALAPALADGWRITGFHDHRYLLETR